ncbi:MAG TPA: RNA pseudouridine synthase [Chthoniobacterales bacterium]|jgi:23S rRNA pseudouridine1911/1915/1917 synthase|nr:RNA pseudouridine synthase [Chthoniobacterales bacterium]
MPASAHLPTAKAHARTPPKFRIIAESPDYLVVDKPPFLLIHPNKPDGTPTLWAALRELLAFELVNGGQVSIVNRLDRETSGLVLIAKHAVTARRFGLAMQAQLVAKEYLAIVCGWPAWETTMVDAPLARQGAHGPSAIWLKQAIHEKGAPAVTEFRVEKRFVRPGNPKDRWAVVRAFPRTGRTHQIRVHLAHLGHPIVGDKIYGPDEGHYLRFIETGWTDELASQLFLPRHALHSARISLEGEFDWQSPLPEDLQNWMRSSPHCHPERSAPEPKNSVD